MASYTPTEWRGLLIPDPRVTDDNIDTTNSTHTQAGPRTGVPVDQDGSSMVLQATGSKTAADDIEIYTQKAGYPGVHTRGGGWLWRYAADAPGGYRGWNVPNVPTGHEWIGHDDGTNDMYDDPHVIRLQNDTALAAFRHKDVLVGPNERIGTAILSTAGVWTDPTATGNLTIVDGDTNTKPGPTLCQLPSGRVLLAYWVIDSTANEAQVQVRFSDDSGSTWGLFSKYALDTTISTAASTGYTLGRLRMSYSAGQILLVGHIISKDSSVDPALFDPDALCQYASDDLGASFTQVEVLDHTAGDDAGEHDIVALNGGGFLVLYVKDGPSIFSSQSRTIPDAYSPMSAATETAGSADDVEEEGMCAWKSEDGTIYAAWTISSAEAAASIMRVERSIDDGATWAWLDDDADPSSAYPKPRAFWAGETSTVLEEMSACEVMGRTVMLHTQVVAGTPAHEDYALGCLYLGGHTTITMPAIAKFSLDTKQHGLLNTYVSLDTPGNIGHYTTTSSGGTESLDSTGLNTTASSGSTQYYTKTGISTDLTDCLVVVAHLTSVAGGTNADSVRRRTVTLRAADGAEEYLVDINIQNANFEVWDRKAGTQVGSTQTVASTAGLWILAAIRGGVFRCWYHTGASTSDHDWTDGPTSAGLTDGGVGAANYAVEWGTPSNPAGVSQQTDWHMVAYGLHEGIAGLSAAQDTDSLFPRPFSANYLGVDDGVRFRAVDGPAATTEEWNIPIAYAYPIRAVDPMLYPSPRYVWRSTDTTQNQIIWEVDSVSTTYLESEMGAIYLGGINFATATLAGWDGATWKTLATIDAKLEGTSVGYTRQGAVVFSDLGTEHTTSFLGIDEAKGGTFKLDGTYFRKIGRHTEGVWHKDGLYPRLYLEGITGAEPASGTGEIWMPSVCVVWNDTAGGTNVGDISKYRLTIDAQTTVDGYFEIGTIMIGRFLPVKQYSEGRSLSVDENVSMSELSDGTRYTRVQGPPRRSATFAWREGVDESKLYDGAADHTYFDLGGTRAGVVEATPLVLDSLIDRLDGQHTPVVYLPSWTASRMTQRLRSEMLYGRIVGGVRREVVVGDERSTEVHRVQTMTIEEEV